MLSVFLRCNMKVFLKKNRFFFLSLLAVLFLIGYSVYEYATTYSSAFSDNVFYTLFTIFVHFPISNLQVAAPLFIMIAAVPNFQEKLKSGFIKNELTRMSYRKWMVQNVLSAWKVVILFPIAMLFFIVLSYFVSNRDFMYHFTYIGPLNPELYPSSFSFWFYYLLTIVTHSIFYVNLGLIFCKKNKNAIVTIVEAFLVFMGLNVISELGFGTLVGRFSIFPQYAYLFNLFGYWLCDVYTLSIKWNFVVALVLALGSLFCLYLTYRKKEEVLYEVDS